MNILNQIAITLLLSTSALQIAAQERDDYANYEDTACHVHTETAEATLLTETGIKNYRDYHFSIRANLLRWATLTPDLGVEWRINRNIGITVDGSWTNWSRGGDHRYALREITPGLRLYLGKESRAYIGAIYKAGAFNYKFSATGRQGNINGGGITGGYMLPLNRRLHLDLSLTIGYLHARYDKYNIIDGVHVRAGHNRKNWLGPINAGVTLVWNI